MTYATATFAGLLVGAVLCGPVAADDAPATLPSYEAQRQAFERERAKDTDGPSLTEADRAVMNEAQRDLARRMPSPGLETGERAPDFTLPNAFGQPVHLYERLAQGPVVLTFYRGAWCPYCNLELHTLRQSLPAFRRHGAQLIAVTPQQPDKSREQIRKDGYPFEILSDLDSEVMRDYRLYFQVSPPLVELYKKRFGLDLAEYNGKDRYVLPVPGTFVIDRDGIVRAAHANVDYRQRMEPAAIVDALKRLDR